LLPGMLLISVNDESVEHTTFDDILLLLDEPHVRLIFQETFEDIKQVMRITHRNSMRQEYPAQLEKMSISSDVAANLGLTETVGDIVFKKIQDNSESMFTSKLVGAEVIANSSSASVKSVWEETSCSVGRQSLVKSDLANLVLTSSDETHRWLIHPVVDKWPRLLQSDEYMTVFQSRPLGIRVRKDWEGKNAVVWKIKGQHAKAAGVEQGSMVYSINEEPVYGWQHSAIVNKLLQAPLPLNIIFWRTVVIAD
jgi:hypothetical protein